MKSKSSEKKEDQLEYELHRAWRYVSRIKDVRATQNRGYTTRVGKSIGVFGGWDFGRWDNEIWGV